MSDLYYFKNNDNDDLERIPEPFRRFMRENGAAGEQAAAPGASEAFHASEVSEAYNEPADTSRPRGNESAGGALPDGAEEYRRGKQAGANSGMADEAGRASAQWNINGPRPDRQPDLLFMLLVCMLFYMD